MCSSRERMLAAIKFTRPDRIPVFYGASPAGLYVHGRKLQELFQRLPPDNAITWNRLTTPDSKNIGRDGEYHEFKKDVWGTEWEFRIFGIQGHPHRYALTDWKEAEKFSFPPIARKADQAKIKDGYLTWSDGVSLFEKLHALRPFDEVLMDIFTEEPALMRFLDLLTEYWEQVIAAELQAGTDIICFGDDWGMQTAPFIPPELFRKIFLPRYQRLMRPIHEAGKLIMFHSCGFTGAIGYELLDLGINIYWPQIRLFEHDAELTRRLQERKITLLLHPDRQHLVPKGTPEQIKDEIKRYAEHYRELGGGAIFYIEIENDASWENVAALLESIHHYR